MKGKLARRLTSARTSANSMLLLFNNTDETSLSVLLKEGEICIVNILSELTTDTASDMSDIMYNSKSSDVVEHNC